MSYTYAVQVPVGQELKVKAMIESMLKRFGNPGIMRIHALETFTQTLREKGLSARQWRAKLPGYIFVTISNTESISSNEGGNCSAGLGMEASCWQFIKQVPLVRKILNRYISHDEWKNFFDNVDLEPEIQLIDEEATDVGIMPHTENSPKEPSNVTLIETVTGVVEEKLEEVKGRDTSLQKAVATVRTVLKGRKRVYTIPYKLYKSFVSEDRQKGGAKMKPMSFQSALLKLKILTEKAVSICRT